LAERHLMRSNNGKCRVLQLGRHDQTLCVPWAGVKLVGCFGGRARGEERTWRASVNLSCNHDSVWILSFRSILFYTFDLGIKKKKEERILIYTERFEFELSGAALLLYG